jgi:hypothetical protein
MGLPAREPDVRHNRTIGEHRQVFSFFVTTDDTKTKSDCIARIIIGVRDRIPMCVAWAPARDEGIPPRRTNYPCHPRESRDVRSDPLWNSREQEFCWRLSGFGPRAIRVNIPTRVLTRFFVSRANRNQRVTRNAFFCDHHCRSGLNCCSDYA